MKTIITVILIIVAVAAVLFILPFANVRIELAPIVKRIAKYTKGIKKD